jgi:molybdopterin-dependent oxidoreductase alpha subunit
MPERAPSSALVPLRAKGSITRRPSAMPFGIGETKPHHYLEMLRILWENRGSWGYAWRVLSRGVCDGCALGTTGLSDWTIDGTHLCLVRLNLLRLNTMGALDVAALGDVSALERKNARELRDLGRIPYPMRRMRGERGFTRVSWDEALEDLGARLRATDPRRMACYMTSRGITNEVYFAVQKAWRLLGSPHIDNAARLCHSPSTAAMKRVLGVAASTCSYTDWYGADVIVFFGSNPANDQPVAMKYLHEAKKRGTRVYVVNTYEEPGMRRYWIPSTPESAVFGSAIADGFFRVSTGGDLAFVYAVQKVLIERGAVDEAFVRDHTDGFYAYKDHLAHLELDDLVRRAGTTREDIMGLADVLTEARTGVFVWSMGITQHMHGADTVAAICCLGLSKGFVGREKTGLMPIRGHSGVQGGAEMGAYATAFPGGQPIHDGTADALAELWGFRPPVEPGLDAVAMLEAAAEGKLDVLYQVGGNFRDTLPQPAAVDRALSRVPVRIHQDIVLTHPMLLEPADVVYLLPARTRYEHRGGVTETTTERRVVFSPHVPGHDVGEAREEWRIAVDLAHAVQPDKARAHLMYEDAAAIRRDIARTVPFYAGIAELREQGDVFQWGGPRLCDGGQFPLPGGRARFVTSDPPDRSLPAGRFHLSTRRGKQFNSIVQAEVDQLTGAARDHLFMSASDMEALGLVPDQRVRVRSEHGKLLGRVFAAPMTPGNVQMHWPEANVLIGSNRVDAGGRVPDYNAVVIIEPLERPAEGAPTRVGG